MTKADLIKTYAEATGQTAAQAGDDLEKLSHILTATLLGGDEVPLLGIGKLKSKATKAREARNPNTGEKITIPAGARVAFVVSKALKDALKGE